MVRLLNFSAFLVFFHNSLGVLAFIVCILCVFPLGVLCASMAILLLPACICGHWAAFKRFGCLANGAQDIKNHIYFQRINWLLLYEKKVHSEYRPQIIKGHEYEYFEEKKEFSIPKSSICLFEKEFQEFWSKINYLCNHWWWSDSHP